jgi:hypothetical protein
MTSGYVFVLVWFHAFAKTITISKKDLNNIIHFTIVNIQWEQDFEQYILHYIYNIYLM